MKGIIKAAAFVSIFALTCGSAWADYTGQTIDGTLAFGPNGSYGGQYWSADTITAPGTFYYADGYNTDTAAFTGTTLTVTDDVLDTADGWGMTFSDSSMPFTSLTLVSDDFSPDMTYSLSGGVITLDWTGSPASDVTYSATFDIAAPSAGLPGLFCTSFYDRNLVLKGAGDGTREEA